MVFNNSLKTNGSEKEVDQARMDRERGNVGLERRKGGVGDSDEKVGTDLAGGERRGLVILSLGEKQSVVIVLLKSVGWCFYF